MAAGTPARCRRSAQVKEMTGTPSEADPEEKTAVGIHPAHHVADRAVLARCVDARLERGIEVLRQGHRRPRLNPKRLDELGDPPATVLSHLAEALPRGA
jgi:hypothetical protein